MVVFTTGEPKYNARRHNRRRAKIIRNCHAGNELPAGNLP